MRKISAEFLGTLMLVFAGCGAIVTNQETGGTVVTHFGVAVTFGLIVMAGVFALGDVSGAHFNPSVSLAFAAAGRLPWRELPTYLASQLAGGLAGVGLLRILFPTNATLGLTQPRGSEGQSFLLELILTWILMFVVFGVSTGAKEKGITAAIAVGGIVGLEALFAGPISGASMNPIRSLAPAVMTQNFSHLWLYLVAPCAGALLAIPACRLTRGPDCCRPTPTPPTPTEPVR